MKKYIWILCLVLLAGSMLISCGKRNTPEAVADKFLTHLGQGEFEEAAKYSTRQTGQMLAMLAAFTDDDFKQREKHKNLQCVVEQDRAKCTYTIGAEEETLGLVKEDGIWLVDQQK